jgi:cytochrome c-type biogenesis protein CcmE
MNRQQKIRTLGIVCICCILSAAVGLVLFALKQNINLFYTPTEVLAHTVGAKKMIRLGGYVQTGSVYYTENGAAVKFSITDRVNIIAVNYHGILPSLFREGQGVVASGYMQNAHTFLATQVLAKHDEKYMPASLLKKLSEVKHNAS